MVEGGIRVQGYPEIYEVKVTQALWSKKCHPVGGSTFTVAGGTAPSVRIKNKHKNVISSAIKSKNNILVVDTVEEVNPQAQATS